MGRYQLMGRSHCTSFARESRISVFQVLNPKRFLDDHTPSTLAALLGLSHKSRKLIRKEGGVSSGGVLTCVESLWSASLQ